MKYDRNYYEGNGSNYGKSGGYSSWFSNMVRYFIHRKAMTEIRKHKTHGKLLEVGCAYGYFLNEASKSFEVKGCDISAYAIAEANRRFPHVDAFQADIERGLQLPKKSFDVIASFEMLEHCKDLTAIFKEVKRLLKPDGLFIASVPDHEFFTHDDDETHVWFLDQKGWIKQFEKHFTLLEAKKYPNWLMKIKPEWPITIYTLSINGAFR